MSLYGVGEALTRESHEFESHYLYGLMGARPDEPGMEPVYHQRSPVFHADEISMPLLRFFKA
ncbi:hypothetical protein PAXINDRAFT_7974 [Paxillus involutus ATCC 200175]|nr:hypothetical protein PAXINDRAFT_7974 [Paxillus involutus ATCC 200175]